MEVKGVPKGSPTIAINGFLLGAAWIAVVLRVYTRTRIIKHLYAEDWLLIVSLAWYTVFCGTVIALARTIEIGGGQHLTFERVLLASKLGFLGEMWYITTLVFLKIAIALFFYRIALERWKKIFICAIIVPLTLFSIATVVYNGFHCGVFDSFLVFLLRKIARQCAPDRVTLAITYTHAALTALTDWSFALMPILILHGTLMSRKEKVVVGFLMGFASISGVASLIRFRYVESIVESTETVFVATENLAIWSCIEIGVGIIATSVAQAARSKQVGAAAAAYCIGKAGIM